MSKAKELVTIIAPGVAAGLLGLYAVGAITVACAANAVIAGAALLVLIGVGSAAVEAACHRVLSTGDGDSARVIC